MAVQIGGRAPYAPASAIIKVIEKHRQTNLRTIDPSLLQRIGVTPALAPRTMQALSLLDFVDEGGRVTPAFDALRTASSHEFKPRLAEMLRAAYAEVLTLVDPANPDQQEIENAFRGVEPTGQLPRIVQLFTGLLSYAEIMPEMAKRRPGPTQQQRPAASRDKSVASATQPPPPQPPAAVPRPRDTHTRTLRIATGDTISLTVDVNPLALRGADRKFFFALVDLLDEYEANTNSPPQSADGADQSSEGSSS